MLKLRPLQPNEFNQFRDIGIYEYQQDLIENHKMREQDALLKSQKSIDDSFPNGNINDNTMLQCIEMVDDESPKNIGFIWYNIENNQSAFILDFYIFEEFQDLGYGRKTIELIEQQIKDKGLQKIGLRVAPRNEVALHLYQKAGFEITGFNMVKFL